MSLDATKIASLSLLTLITLFVGLLPIKLYDYIKRREENAANKSKYLRAEFIMSLVLCLGGGVLIATAFLHMLPEARENITFGLSQGVHAAEEHVHEEPAADAIRFDHGHDEHGHAGHDHAHDHSHGDAHNHDHGHGDAHDHDHGIQDNANANAMEFGQDHASKRTLSKRRILHSETSTEAGVSIADEAENHEHAHNYPWTELILSLGCLLIYFIEEVGHALLEKSAKKPEQVQLARTFSVRGSGRKPVSIPRVSPQKMTTTPSEASTLPAMELGEAKKSTANLIAEESHHHGHMLPLESVESFTDGLRAAVAVLAVSVHALFEGLAIGLEDEPQNVWIVFAAVGAHKFMIAFSIGMELVATNTRKLLIFIYTFCFAIVSPVGVGIGMLITRLTTGEGASSETQKLVLGVLQSLAAGTIVYVAFFEILQREKARTQGGPKGYVQFLLIAIGFSVMAVLEALTPHSHSH